MNLSEENTKIKITAVSEPREPLGELRHVVFELEGQERRYLNLPAWVDPNDLQEVVSGATWTPHQELATALPSLRCGSEVLNALYNSFDADCRGPACQALRDAKHGTKKYRTGVVAQTRIQRFIFEVAPA